MLQGLLHEKNFSSHAIGFKWWYVFFTPDQERQSLLKRLRVNYFYGIINTFLSLFEHEIYQLFQWNLLYLQLYLFLSIFNSAQFCPVNFPFAISVFVQKAENFLIWWASRHCPHFTSSFLFWKAFRESLDDMQWL